MNQVKTLKMFYPIILILHGYKFIIIAYARFDNIRENLCLI